MGTAIRIAGANFSNYVDREVPYLGLAGAFYLFGGDAAASKVNLAPNPSVAEATIGGAPTYGEGYAGMKPSTGDYFDSGIAPVAASDFTMIAVCSSSQQTYGGTYHSGTAGSMIYRNNATATYFNSRASNAGNILFNQGASIAFMAGVRSGANGTLYAHNGTEMLSATAAGGSGTATNTYRVGPVGGIGNQADTTVQRHAAAMMFPVALTGAQILELYNYLKWKLAQRGVAIL